MYHHNTANLTKRLHPSRISGHRRYFLPSFSQLLQSHAAFACQHADRTHTSRPTVFVVAALHLPNACLYTLYELSGSICAAHTGDFQPACLSNGHPFSRLMSEGFLELLARTTLWRTSHRARSSHVSADIPHGRVLLVLTEVFLKQNGC